MPTFTLQGNYHFAIPVTVAGGLLPLFGTNLPRVETEKPVNIYVVDLQGLNLYRQGALFVPLDRAIGVTQFNNRVLRLNEGQYYVLIENPSYEGTAVHYE